MATSSQSRKRPRTDNNFSNADTVGQFSNVGNAWHIAGDAGDVERKITIEEYEAVCRGKKIEPTYKKQRCE